MERSQIKLQSIIVGDYRTLSPEFHCHTLENYTVLRRFKR